MKKFLVSVFFLAPLFLLFSQTQADRDAPKRDVFVILDVSGSMINQNKFSSVQEYLSGEVIDGLLKNGDTFSLITFGDYAVEQFSRSANSDADKQSIKADLAKIEPNHNYTDIGMAMEKLAEVLEKREQSGVRRIILFITDGLNAPPPGSPYSGRDLAVDERFRSLGEKISRGGWFLYVVGIGGQTDAQAIADAVPGSVLQTTGSDLEGLDVDSYADQVEEKARAKEEAEASEKAARKAGEKRNSGIEGFFRRAAAGLGVSFRLLLGILGLVVLLVIVAVVLLRRIFRTIEIVITDEKETLIKKLSPFGGIMVNSVAALLPALGNENNQVMRIQRGAFNLKVNILDPQAIAKDSAYQKRGIHPLKGVISLANGKLIRVTIR
ncbi:MAG: VWA domain-containing protein [Treponema sp.]|nr:VWA domain-containing protein [Treponema sp.]